MWTIHLAHTKDIQKTDLVDSYAMFRVMAASGHGELCQQLTVSLLINHHLSADHVPPHLELRLLVLITCSAPRPESRLSSRHEPPSTLLNPLQFRERRPDF